MTDQMFFFQCEQTAKCEACTGRAGACGKTEDVAAAQDELTGALIGLARTCQAAGKVGERTYELVVNGLFTCVTNVNFNEFSVRALIAETHTETAAVAEIPADLVRQAGQRAADIRKAARGQAADDMLEHRPAQQLRHGFGDSAVGHLLQTGAPAAGQDHSLHRTEILLFAFLGSFCTPPGNIPARSFRRSDRKFQHFFHIFIVWSFFV